MYLYCQCCVFFASDPRVEIAEIGWSDSRGIEQQLISQCTSLRLLFLIFWYFDICCCWYFDILIFSLSWYPYFACLLISIFWFFISSNSQILIWHVLQPISSFCMSEYPHFIGLHLLISSYPPCQRMPDRDANRVGDEAWAGGGLHMIPAHNWWIAILIC